MASTHFEALTQGTEHETAPGVVQVRVVGVKDVPVVKGEYAFHQGDVTERGQLGSGGLASAAGIDPARPFLFEIRDRVCAIRDGAFINPDDPRIEYGGTWFEWTLVRDDLNPAKRFWPHYRKEMDGELRRGVDCFMQHEHVTRRPIQIAKPTLLQRKSVTIRATPARVRVGPFVRYTDHQRAVIWLETVTPAMVRVRYRPAGTRTDSSFYASTVRVGGRYYAAVEIQGLQPDTFYDYTIELAPLPAKGTIPIAQADFVRSFPELTATVTESMKAQFAVPSLDKEPWLSFRTLLPRYERNLRFATGSCRWYPGDKDHAGKDWGPDMLEGLGRWLRSVQAQKREKWPHFLFLGGDQIYADEIGLHHGEQLASARFASRIPGPADRGTPRDKLVDGAWAGRFAHRFHAYKDPEPRLAVQITRELAQLDALHKQVPDLKNIYREYPDKERKKALQDRYVTLRNKRQMGGAKAEAQDEREARLALDILTKVEPLEVTAEPFRAMQFHWRRAPLNAAWRSPMSANYLAHNFALWSIPDFETDLPSVSTSQQGWTFIRKTGARAHPPAERGVHAADFAEYAYLYQRAWTTSPTVRMLLAHVPTFLMFDDHEATDDWNFDVEWVRMLHNAKDEYRMWPKTLTDALAAYWVYQGWCNKAPSQWSPNDPRVAALIEARRTGADALPELRRCIHRACFTPVPSKDPAASYQTGLDLDWHYRLPFDPPFLVPDCRTRRLIVPEDDKLRAINHEIASKAPQSRTIDQKQLEWMRRIIVDQRSGWPAVFIAPSTPLLMSDKFMTFMMEPEVAAGAWSRGDILGGVAAVLDSTKLGLASDAVLRAFRRTNDLEHMIRDRSWQDLWSMLDDMRKNGSTVKTVVFVSGDVHHSYCMTANAARTGRPRPEALQITCSGLQTRIRKSKKSSLAENLSSVSFNVGRRRLVPGFVLKRGTGAPDLILYENAAALVDVSMAGEVDVTVTYLAGHVAVEQQVQHIYKYTSGAAYLKDGEPAALASAKPAAAPAQRQGQAPARTA